MSTSSTTGRTASSTRSTMRRPPSSSNAFGSPPMRVLLPPAWITPVTRTSDLDRARTDHAGRVHGDVEHRGGLAARRGAAVEHEIDRVTEVGHDPGRRGGRHALGGIRARRGDGPAQRVPPTTAARVVAYF